MRHTHDDTDRLTVGCTACIDQVRRDQVRAELLAYEGPVTLVVTAEHTAEQTVTIYAEKRAGEDGVDLADRLDVDICELLPEDWKHDWTLVMAEVLT